MVRYNSFKHEDESQLSGGYSTFKASNIIKVYTAHYAKNCEKSLNVKTMSVVSTDGSHLINRKKVYNNTFEFNWHSRHFLVDVTLYKLEELSVIASILRWRFYKPTKHKFTIQGECQMQHSWCSYDIDNRTRSYIIRI